MIKIGTCVDFKTVDTLETQFKTLVDNGFDNCQFMCWKMELMNEENAKLVRELTDKYGITISALWCGWVGPSVWNFYEGQTTLGLVPPEYRWERVKNLCHGSDFAKMIGTTDVITHMGFIPENPNDVNFRPFCDAVRYVAAYCKKNGQYLLFETGQETPVTLLRCFETVSNERINKDTEIDIDNLGINLDTANCILYGRANPVDAIDVFGKYVRNLHAKDGRFPTDGHSLGKETKIGEGKVDFDAVIRDLHALGYDRYITIEREISGDQQLKDIIESRDYLQSIIDKYYK